MIRSQWSSGTALHVVGMCFTLAVQWLLPLMMAVRMTWMMPPSILLLCEQSSLLPSLPPHSLWTLNPTLTPASPHHQASPLPPHSSAASSPSTTWWMWTQQHHFLTHFQAHPGAWSYTDSFSSFMLTSLQIITLLKLHSNNTGYLMCYIPDCLEDLHQPF